VLSAQGVEYIFGVPGAKIDAVYDAWSTVAHSWWCAGMNRTPFMPERSVASPASRASCS